jgi:hypothetical protein
MIKESIMKMLHIIAVGLVLGGLSGCETWNSMGKTEKGAIIGAGSGALIGTAVTGDAKGAVIGGAVGAVGGGVVGHEMDE